MHNTHKSLSTIRGVLVYTIICVCNACEIVLQNFQLIIIDQYHRNQSAFNQSILYVIETEVKPTIYQITPKINTKLIKIVKMY